MEKATATPEVTKMSEVLKMFAELVDSQLDQCLKQNGQGNTILGYDMIAFSSKKNVILQNIQLLNDLMTLYSKYLVGKPIDKETLTEILALPIDSNNLLVLELKKKYLEWNKIQIPEFPFVKMSKLIEIFEFSNDAEELIKEFVSRASQIESSQSVEALRHYKKYFDSGIQSLSFSENHESQLLHSCTSYVSEHKLHDILSAHLLCVALNNLKRQDYDFNEMPEIDFRIMNMISVKEHGSYVEVDLDAINGEGISEESPDVEFEYLGESKISGLPIFRLGDIEYEYVAPAFLSPFNEQVNAGNSSDTKRIEILDYTSPVRREQFIRYSLRLAKLGSGVIARRKE